MPESANRNQTGAVIGVQPFGGQGLSGTGPKAGGPHYLPRFASEKTLGDWIARRARHEAPRPHGSKQRPPRA